MTRPLIIVGGGPAGLGAAILAAQQGLSPLVVEPKQGVIDKACGEGLMPGALRRLQAMGVDPRGHDFVGIRYRDAESDISADGHFPKAARGVRRLALHQAMLERAASLGVEFLSDRVLDLSQTAESVQLTTQGGLQLSAEHVIAADGLHSQVRRALGIHVQPPKRRRFGVRRHYQLQPWSDFVEVFWSPRGEAYVTPVSDDCVGVALLYEPKSTFDELLLGFPWLAQQLQGAPQVSKDQGAGPFDQSVGRHQVGRVLLAGDAAGYLDPLTGEGVALGLATAEAAVQAIMTSPETYERRYRRATRRYYVLTKGLLLLTRPRSIHRPLIKLLREAPFVFDRALRALAG